MGTKEATKNRKEEGSDFFLDNVVEVLKGAIFHDDPVNEWFFQEVAFIRP